MKNKLPNKFEIRLEKFDNHWIAGTNPIIIEDNPCKVYARKDKDINKAILGLIEYLEEYND